VVDCVWNVVAHAQKPDFVFRTSPFKSAGTHFSRLLAAEVCASAVVMLDTPSSEVVWGVLATHSILQFSLHFLSRASPCAITFQLDSNIGDRDSEVSNVITYRTPFRGHTTLCENVVMLFVCALLIKCMGRWSKISGLRYTYELNFNVARCTPRIFIGEGGLGWPWGYL
jgi:hypothetical protein